MNTAKTTPEYQIGPFPWKSTKYEHLDSLSISDATASYARAVIVTNSIRAEWAEKDAEAITKAVNGTYGAGIDPTSIAGLLDALNRILLGASAFNETYVVIPKMELDVIHRAIEKAKLNP